LKPFDPTPFRQRIFAVSVKVISGLLSSKVTDWPEYQVS